ncbi:MAG TPA: NADH-quinone oxidoreductase subunit J [Myxococcota bacterium]|nr:NADH-quinone oxidoreductase subunit J [Myxococcota bacterium]
MRPGGLTRRHGAARPGTALAARPAARAVASAAAARLAAAAVAGLALGLALVMAPALGGGQRAWAADGPGTAASAGAAAAAGAALGHAIGPAPAAGVEIDAATGGGEGLTVQKVVFLCFAVAAVILALLVISMRNPLSGALALVLAFFCLAGLYAMLGAHFIAAIQIIVYAGAVMVLFVFVIMLLNLSERELGAPKHRFVKGLGVLLLVGLGAAVWANLKALQGPAAAGPTVVAAVDAHFGTVKAVGRALFSGWLFPFEATGLLLLVAVVAAVAISRKGTTARGGDAPAGAARTAAVAAAAAADASAGAVVGSDAASGVARPTGAPAAGGH